MVFILAVFLMTSLPLVSQTDILPSCGIIPAPRECTIRKGKTCKLTSLSVYVPEYAKNAFTEKVLSGTPGVRLVSSKEKGNVIFILNQRLANEDYRLTVSKKEITIEASQLAGFQYALTSLIQMISHNGMPLPQCEIKDSPAFRYRGMHLDVGRHFFAVEDVRKYIDYIAYYKFNHFHWHLTEDQGWRIEIKKYPRLQEVSAWRSQTLVGHYNDQPQQFDGKRYGGYYTQEEVREIVRYAADRGITVVPEIEMPGHALAAIAAYPELGCGPGPYEVGTKWGIYDDVFCPNEATFTFLQDVIDEIIPLFPGKYIHIGGDECPKAAWEKSEFCKDLMKREGLKDAHALQSYFITRMEKYINSKGKQIIGWDEILEGGLAPNVTVMSWRGVDGGIAAATQDHDVIMTPTDYCYFDYYQSESPDEPLAIGGYLPLEKVYNWTPVPPGLTPEKHKYILGGQANVWTEYISQWSKLEYMAYARAMALSEAVWNSKKEYNGFLRRFSAHQRWWTDRGVNVASHVYELKPVVKAGDGYPVRVSFTLPADARIAHKINGNDAGMMNVGQEVSFSHSGRHEFTAHHPGGTGKPLAMNVELHLATMATIAINPSPAPKYAGNGPGSLINGIKGDDERYGGSEWLGFEGDDVTITLDFGKDRNIQTVETRFFKGEGQWIYLPKELEVYTSMDGVDYKRASGIKNIDTPGKIADVRLNPYQAHGRFVQLRIKNYGVIPEGRQGAGHRAWLFMDEIIIN